MRDQAVEPNEKYSVPVIDRMMEIFGELEKREEGLSITALTEALRQPRTTIYRILNTLTRHGMVSRDDKGRYTLGTQLLVLASRVADTRSEALVGRAQPVLDRLAETTGEGVKLSVVDAQGVLVLATAQGRRQYALTVTPGQRIPIHVGAAGKLLLANMRPAERETWIGVPDLHRFTDVTLTDRADIDAELDRIQKQGWAVDRGEHSASINAVAAPVRDRDGALAGVISIPFLAGQPEERIALLRDAVIGAAEALSAALAG
ncbi:IclR family transcriptional regulator [Pelagovum pacificum]|uniref:IclR family transcriptional regulator n=1 Tax=Pelagovum pacificum TaxID=2588711 RepID=A0A5C5GF38_9RHOB|nr:IclR family transcriptional regulator [Pelagovum pacificum]QQA43511.1 IclR family transcriptional regulator [Pelagovum pacificum]TNY33353.1 IclR family transcriptional regulator [Pelagovum pacificum]